VARETPPSPNAPSLNAAVLNAAVRVRVVALAAVLALGLLSTLSWLAINQLHDDMQDLRVTRFTLFDDAWQVRFLDEALTHSTSEYVLTADPIWKQRYQTDVDRLEVVLARLGQRGGATAMKPLDEVNDANERLIDLETDVFQAVDSGFTEDARLLLEGPYVEQKRKYQAGVERLFSVQRKAIDGELLRVTRLTRLLTFASLIPGLLLALAVMVIARGSSRTTRLANERDRVRDNALRLQATERRITQSLDMAQREDDLLDVVRAVLVSEHPQGHVELLFADSSRAHLRQVMSTDATTHGPGCEVRTPSDCPAIRRGAALHFADPADYSACPQLRRRTLTGCTASCVPVALLGQTVGVLHTVVPTNGVDDSVDGSTSWILDRLASQVGDRVGVMRTLEQTKLQAAIDPLSGLLNRRSLEYGVSELIVSNTDYSVVLFDLDHFKSLTDQHGHQTGDHAIRLFSKLLRDSLRSADLICRWGGEEFLVVLPNAAQATAAQLAERVREQLSRSTAGGEIPRFTVSAGIAEARRAEPFHDVVARADAALFAAKQAGRNRASVAAE
jgi:diguanylate cyclase (GGDEF)-like protein